MASWYARTRITAASAQQLVDVLIPGRIVAFQAAIAAGHLAPQLGRRKIAREQGWITRLRAWLGGRRW